MTTVYIIRHCQAQANVQKVFQGHFDGTISEVGKRQLSCLRQRFENKALDAVYTSPLLRARLTADAVCPSSVIDDRLIEIDVGDLEQRSIEEAKRLYPDAMHQWYENAGAFVAPNGESMEQVYERISQIFDYLVSRHLGQTIALVTHGCAIRNLLCYISGLPVDRIQSIDWVDNTSVTKVLVDEKGNRTIAYQNDLSHYSPDLLSKSGNLWFSKESL